ncbi:hypothetical protein I5Q22_02960 [Serratia marcescens]|nr:hypothetical protein [Serratia marcescens]MBH2671423.1 hypothetical protein [Serratia marcescens]
MGMKLISMIAAGCLLFFIGFLLGGVDWGAEISSFDRKIAFWTMLGGWLSGLATLAAVIISLYMAYTAAQSVVEKINISLAEFVEDYPSPGESFVRLMFKNSHNVRAEIINVGVQFDKMTEYVSISNLKSGGYPIPHVLEKSGQVLEFFLYINASPILWEVFERMEGVTFSKGFFVVETTMKIYELKMDSSVLSAFKKRYEMNNRLKEGQGN